MRLQKALDAVGWLGHHGIYVIDIRQEGRVGRKTSNKINFTELEEALTEILNLYCFAMLQLGQTKENFESSGEVIRARNLLGELKAGKP